MESSQPDLRLVEPPSPEELMPMPIHWELWCVAGGILLILALIAFFMWRRSKRRKTGNTDDIRLQAHKDALANLALCPSENRTQTATECSIILRRYLIKVTGDRALFETHEEWVARRDSIESLGATLQKQVETLCSQLANSKYAPADTGGDPDAMIESTRQLIEAVHQEVMS